MGGVKGDVFAGVNRGEGEDDGWQTMDGRDLLDGGLCSDMAEGRPLRGAKWVRFEKKS